MVRYSSNFAGWKLRKAVATDLGIIYTAATLEGAGMRLAQFDAKRGVDYLSIVQFWQRNWARIIRFFDFPAGIRKVIYTTNAIESVNMSLRKIIKSRGSFHNDEAPIKLY
jgi:putative transposase